jgi:hypothetical protein
VGRRRAAGDRRHGRNRLVREPARRTANRPLIGSAVSRRRPRAVTSGTAASPQGGQAAESRTRPFHDSGAEPGAGSRSAHALAAARLLIHRLQPGFSAGKLKLRLNSVRLLQSDRGSNRRCTGQGDVVVLPDKRPRVVPQLGLIICAGLKPAKRRQQQRLRRHRREPPRRLTSAAAAPGRSFARPADRRYG